MDNISLNASIYDIDIYNNIDNNKYDVVDHSTNTNSHSNNNNNNNNNKNDNHSNEDDEEYIVDDDVVDQSDEDDDIYNIKQKKLESIKSQREPPKVKTGRNKRKRKIVGARSPTKPAPDGSGQIEIDFNLISKDKIKCVICEKEGIKGDELFFKNREAFKVHFKAHYNPDKENANYSSKYGQYLSCYLCTKEAADKKQLRVPRYLSKLKAKKGKRKQGKGKNFHSHIGNLISHFATHSDVYPHPFQCAVETWNPQKNCYESCPYTSTTEQNLGSHAYKIHFRDNYDENGEYECTKSHGYHNKAW
eukprot:CAMPEP_0201594946 /NCGR_PEP_ID=MMETSP0190_2-20130828/192105_1 /ASSEMBLY_ACC=CAM_ASM_000263 /TAXON_ID=37353 /ORGANISM="Rosalina sp." /LENGTH=303 /DNA_ID=CAMNT_0048054751 /DNA_START=697 /DNA_END=1605 /DNA_ORIENTATION=-